MSRALRRSVLAAACLGTMGLPPVATAQEAMPGATVDTVLHFTAADGTPLEAMLSVPAAAAGPVPVVFLLHGAGARNYDNAVQYRDAEGRLQVESYYGYYARELARRGVAFFRMSKRGCTVEPSGRPVVDRAVFSTATPSVLLSDYARALDVLRARPEVNPSRIVLTGSSEGTRLAPRLALASPSGITGLVLTSYAADNQQETIRWQNTVGPWRMVTRLIPAAEDGTVSRAEYDAALARDASIARSLPFARFDADSNGMITATELAGVVRPRLDAILKAVEDSNDDFLWQVVANLTTAYLREDWDGPPTSTWLLQLPVPVGIFHGDLDGATRVEGVRETEAAFRAAGRTDLTVRIYHGYDHDLNWTPQGAAAGGPEPFRDAFDFMARMATRR